MSEVRVNALRGVELNVISLDESAAFYSKCWGLEEVAHDGATMYLRAGGAEHHILTLHEKARASLHSIDFAVTDRRAVDEIVAAAAPTQYGVRSLIHAIAASPLLRMGKGDAARFEP